ncbi:hypothetical protein Btru_057746 [Bulinus truncatus]|nr:hypothetical protein Btru_057746 [Bulinus truncatus]
MIGISLIEWYITNKCGAALCVLCKPYTKVILTGANNLYFDHPYELDPFEPGLYWARRSLTTKDVYSFAPEDYLKNDLDPNSRLCDSNALCLNRKLSQLEGIQGTLFGELIRSQNIMDFMLLPRVIALAERAWKEAPWVNISDPIRRQSAIDAGWRDFANTMGYRQLFKLDRMGYKYRVPAPGARISNGVLHISVEFPGLVVEMSRNGTRPWVMVISGQVKVAPGELIQLRTRSADSKRHSKVVSIINTLLPI